jgi:hypothetical protein
MPDDGRGITHYAVAWKQDQKGKTFVGSTVRLPWLESDDDPHFGCIEAKEDTSKPPF